MLAGDAATDPRGVQPGPTHQSGQPSIDVVVAELQGTAGTGPEAFTCANMQVNLEQSTTAATGAATAAAATFTGVSALDATLNFAGSYSQDANGVTVTLTGQGYTDGLERSISLTLGNPDGEGKLSGTLGHVRDSEACEGDIELTPADAD